MSDREGAKQRGFAVGDITVIALVSVMMLIGKTVLRVPINIPGHAGVIWIASMIVGRGAIRKPGAATVMGLIGGLLVAFAQPNDGGLFFTVAKYALVGFTLDMLAPLVGRFDRIVPAVFAGAVAHGSKVAIDVIQDFVFGLPTWWIVTDLTKNLVLHIAFGALGGLLGALILQALIRARIPQLRDVSEESVT